MAQQVNVKFVDDLDGSDAAGTVSFAIDGRAYEIDLSEDNAARLRNSLASFVAAARKSGGAAAAGRRAPKVTASSGRRPQPLDREQTAAIRAWARQNGWSSC
jgi:nucleoid-associated protein Lsr2